MWLIHVLGNRNFQNHIITVQYYVLIIKRIMIGQPYGIWTLLRRERREKQGDGYDGRWELSPFEGPTHLPIDVDQQVADLIALN